jgi:hypothetical protein
VGGGHYAAKILHARHERDPAARARFLREAELASRLRHANIVGVHGIYEIAGATALVMELVEGETLARRLAAVGTLGEAEIVALALGIAHGLASAHSAGVIHRDLKPANILLGRHGEEVVPKIADFGMARASSFAGADKGALTVLGTPPYMAPECLDPLAVDPRADVYALGCVLHEMATGAPPFSGATPFAVLDAHRKAPVPSLPHGFGEGLRRLVARMLAKAAGDRPQSAGAVVEALVALRDGNANVHGFPTEGDAWGRCAGCNGAVLPELRLCFRCGLTQVVIEPGPDSVIVTGPGNVSDKLDSGRRERLVQWLHANAGLGLDARRIEQRIPRLPFTLIGEVSDTSAQSLIASLARLDITAESQRGGRFSHEGLRKNALRMTGRRLSLVSAFVLAPGLVHPALLVAGLPALVVVAPVVTAFSVALAGRAMVVATARTASEMPETLQAGLHALHRVVPAIERRRHREALRAVVHRVVQLVRATPTAARDQIADELARALGVAATACLRMDGIEGSMEATDFDPAHPDHRALMQERDQWAARLLDLTATLDSLAARHRAAALVLELGGRDETLLSLRAQVEALEEVRRP